MAEMDKFGPDPRYAERMKTWNGQKEQLKLEAIEMLITDVINDARMAEHNGHDRVYTIGELRAKARTLLRDFQDIDRSR